MCLASLVLAAQPTCARTCLIAHAWLSRSSDGKFSGGYEEQLASELVAYPFEDKKPTIVYVELVRPDSGQKQRVSRDPNRNL